MPYPSLSVIHGEYNAHFGGLMGAMPLNYGDGSAEAAAARRAVGVFDRSDMGKVHMSGVDAVDYLHRRLTNNVAGLRSGEGCEGAILGASGHMHALMSVHRVGRGLLTLSDPVLAHSLRREIEKYVIAEDVVLMNWREAFGAIHLIGPQSLATIARLSETPLELTRQHHVAETIWAVKSRGFAVRYDLGRLPGCLALVPDEALVAFWRAAVEEARAAGGGPGGLQAYDILRVEEGEPRYGREWNEKSIPLEVNLNRLLDFRKGCYPGQEIIARITNLGHPARQLVGLRFESDGEPKSGVPLKRQGEAAGAVATAVRSPILGPIALASVAWSSRAPGTLFDVEGGGHATAEDLPFSIESAANPGN